MEKRKISGKAMREICEKKDFLISSGDFLQSTLWKYHDITTGRFKFSVKGSRDMTKTIDLPEFWTYGCLKDPKIENEQSFKF